MIPYEGYNFLISPLHWRGHGCFLENLDQPKGTNEIQLRGLQSVVHAHPAGASEVEGNFVVRIVSIYYCNRLKHRRIGHYMSLCLHGWSRAVSALLGLACQENLTEWNIRLSINTTSLCLCKLD